MPPLLPTVSSRRKNRTRHDPIDHDKAVLAYFFAAHAIAKIRFDLHRLGLGVVRTQLFNLKNGSNRGGIMSSIVKSVAFQELCQAVENVTSSHDATTGRATHTRSAQEQSQIAKVT